MKSGIPVALPHTVFLAVVTYIAIFRNSSNSCVSTTENMNTAGSLVHGFPVNAVQGCMLSHFVAVARGGEEQERLHARVHFLFG